MSNLFQQAADNLTAEQTLAIAKRGGVLKSNEKSPEEKTYLVLFKYWKLVLTSQVSEDEEITGEAIIVTGRHNCFMKIKSYLEGDYEKDVDLVKSIVLVEGVDAANGVSLKRFLELCNKSYPDEAITEETISEYIEGFNEEHMRTETMASGNGNYGGTLLKED